MSANLVLQRMSLATLPLMLTVSSAIHTQTHPNISSLCPTCPLLIEYLLSSIYPSVSFIYVMLSFTRLLLPSSSSSSHDIPSSVSKVSFPQSVFPLYSTSFSPSLFPTYLPPSRFSSPATTDDACCDVDWMRESQREETAGMD